MLFCQWLLHITMKIQSSQTKSFTDGQEQFTIQCACVWLRNSDGSKDMTTFKKGVGIFKAVAIGITGAVLGIGTITGSAVVAIPAAIRGAVGGLL